jgi:hypothetical protein
LKQSRIWSRPFNGKFFVVLPENPSFPKKKSRFPERKKQNFVKQNPNFARREI